MTDKTRTADAAVPPTNGSDPPSSLAVRFFSDLNAGRIRYWHFKSNRDLRKGLVGETDLDLLVDPTNGGDFAQVAARHGFKRAIGRGPQASPDVDHFFALEEATGALVHLHVYYELLIGGRHVKDYTLGIPPWLADGTRLLDGVRVPPVEAELLLLYLRANLKVRANKVLRSAVRGRALYPGGEMKEFAWLAEQADDAALAARIRASGLATDPEVVSRFVRAVVAGDLSPSAVLRERRRVRRALAGARRGAALARAKKRAATWIRMSRPVRKVAPLPKKVLPGRGLYVAVVGADGSGKSTLVRELVRWLGWKFDVRNPYLGIPKGDLLVWLPRKTRNGIAKVLPKARAARTRLWRFFDRRFWLVVARRRRDRHGAAMRAVARGAVVIAERFPLPGLWQMTEPMDGPRIKPTPGAGQRRGHEREQRFYAEIGEIGEPDLILVLDADLETLRKRDPVPREDIHREKVSVVHALRAHPKAVVIDAAAPPETVLRQAKMAIWRAM